MNRVLVGTCNWSDFQGFYPKGLKPEQRIVYYSQHFPIVEIDSTFYRLMPPRNFELWCERTPDNFVFDVKAYRTLTKHGERYERGARHDAQDADLSARVEEFRAFAESLQPLKDAGKLRAILFQFPPWFTARPSNYAYLAEIRARFPDDLLAVEFRHRSWLEEDRAGETFDKLREFGLAYTAVDQPQLGSGSIPPIAEVTNPALSIVRFHGRNYNTWYVKDAKSSADRFDYLYSPEELKEWVPTVERLAQAANEVHLLMNNNRGNYAIVNAQDMMRLLGQPAPQLELIASPGPEPETGAARRKRG
jgi:uncharacterized protein YecE (DUF72 family)